MATAVETTATVNKYGRRTIKQSETMARGAIDWSNAELFNLYESGYYFLSVMARPAWIEKYAENNTQVRDMLNLFCWILENEFRGLDGIGDVEAEKLEFTDGISTINTIGKITKQSGTELSMTYTERCGLALTKFIEFLLTGNKDPRTQAKTYHGLIKQGAIEGGFQNEVFHLLYIVTDNTMLAVEKAYLLANAWPTKAETSMLVGQKGEIEKKEITIPWEAFVLDGDDIDALAIKVLAYINDAKAVYNVALAISKHHGYDTDDRTGVAETVKQYSDNATRLDSYASTGDESAIASKSIYKAVRDNYKGYNGEGGKFELNNAETKKTATVS